MTTKKYDLGIDQLNIGCFFWKKEWHIFYMICKLADVFDLGWPQSTFLSLYKSWVFSTIWRPSQVLHTSIIACCAATWFQLNRSMRPTRLTCSYRPWIKRSQKSKKSECSKHEDEARWCLWQCHGNIQKTSKIASSFNWIICWSTSRSAAAKVANPMTMNFAIGSWTHGQERWTKCDG